MNDPDAICPTDKGRTAVGALRASLPVCFGYVPLGMIFGVLFIELGYAWWYALLMSLLVFAGAAQFMAVTLLAAGAGVGEIALTTLLLNSRHVFYGLSLAPQLPRRGIGRWYPVFALTDETYSLLTSTSPPSGANPHRFRVLIAAFNQGWWVLGTALGVLLGNGVSLDTHGLDFALTALFVVLTIDQAHAVRDWRPFALAAMAAAIGLILGGRDYMLLIALAIATAMLLLVGWRKP